MSKSKKKSNKSKKSKQLKKTAQPIVKSPKRVTESATAPRIENSTPILAGVFVCFAVALSAGVIMASTVQSRIIKSSAEPSPNTSQQTIEVVEPDTTQAKPDSTEYDIQGSSPGGQTAEGGLQKPAVDPLQPNAGIEDYENAEIN